MATQYDPILKDSTGQAIVTKLEGIKNAINPTAENIPITTIEGMEAENVQEGLEELKQSLVDSSTTTACTNKTGNSAIQYYRFGKVVWINSAYDFSSLNSGWTDLATVPEGFRPAVTNLYGVNTNNSKARQYRIENNVIKVYNPSADSTTNNGAFMFIYMTS